MLKQESDTAIVCLMSGNYVQRGMPAIFSKAVRARAAIECGADLVLELPVTAALSSAEGFAAAGVSILSPFCHRLCFGAETAQKDLLMDAAKALLHPAFSPKLRNELDKGLSFPSARQAAFTQMGLDGSVLETPNNILAIEYCKAILSQKSAMEPIPISRAGAYHAMDADPNNPSATAVRNRIINGESWLSFVPPEAGACYQDAAIHQLHWGEQAMLACLRSMEDEEFEALPYGSEGLWRKLMHAVRSKSTIEQIIAATKSKRYTRTRIDRMLLCAYLGITGAMLAEPFPYVRVLALNATGREVLKLARNHGCFPNAGQVMDSPWQQLEDRWSDLYGLFAKEPEPPGAERNYRIYCKH